MAQLILQANYPAPVTLQKNTSPVELQVGLPATVQLATGFNVIFGSGSQTKWADTSGDPRVGVISGLINNANQVFNFPEAYRAGSAVIFVQGQLQQFSRFTESNAATGEFTLSMVLPAGAFISGSYQPL